MKSYELPESNIYHLAGSSEGTQVKFFSDGKWFKQDLNGYEGETEYIVSCLLSCSNISDYVTYERCMINGKSGCVSENFLRENETFITFERLHFSYTGQHMLDVVMIYSDIRERIEYVKKFIKKNTNLDISACLSKIFSVDALTLNYDRHFNNLGIIYDSEKNVFREAPVFDNGAGLLSNVSKFPVFRSIEENSENIAGQPICANLDLQAYYAGITLQIDYEMFENLYIQTLKPSRALLVLKYQLQQKRKIFPDLKKISLK